MLRILLIITAVLILLNFDLISSTASLDVDAMTGGNNKDLLLAIGIAWLMKPVLSRLLED